MPAPEKRIGLAYAEERPRKSTRLLSNGSLFFSALTLPLLYVGGCDSKDFVADGHADQRLEPARRCSHDPDCVGDWWPGAARCDTIERCLDGRCRPPPTVSGAFSPGKSGWLRGDEGFALKVELVESEFEQARGLMCRAPLPPDWGLYFPLRGALRRGEGEISGAHLSAPLRLLFLDDEGRLIALDQVEPWGTRPMTPAGVLPPFSALIELSLDTPPPPIGTRLWLIKHEAE
ncbi:MAG: DUF192 domain-containing protein [Myxococcota bacterium]|nr:DUF192 domain-containing protein [Myxococcota bacterium]